MIETLTAYDLTPPIEPFALPRIGQSNAIKGLRTGAGTFIWKQYIDSHSTPALNYELDVLQQLTRIEISFSIPAPLPTRDGALWVAADKGRVVLTALLTGRTLDAHTRGVVDPAEVGLYGAALGELHAALRRLPALPRPGRSLFADMFSFPMPAIDPQALEPADLGLAPDRTTIELFDWWRAEATRLQEFVTNASHKLPHQLCHNDVSPANVLVDDGRVSGILDFEFATVAPRALDIAMGLRMSTRTWENPEPWDSVRSFMQAYTQWMPFSAAEALAMPDLLRLRTIIPTLWWLHRFAEAGDSAIILRGMGFLKRLDEWLKGYTTPFVDVLSTFAR